MFRFFLGGLFVSSFATIAIVVKPKTFAGVFGAAPSVALATLGLTVVKDGKGYASTEARSMIVGAVAFFVYASLVSWAIHRLKWGTLAVTSVGISIWLIIAISGWAEFLR